MEKYIKVAKKKEAETAVMISPDEIVFDRRAILKCRWGCEDQHEPNRIKCGSRGLTFEAAQATIREYDKILMIHHHDPVKLSRIAREIERAAFIANSPVNGSV
jgi:predicted metal-binding protein